MSDEERRNPFEEHIESDEFDISQLRYSELSAEDFVLQLNIFALLDKSSHPLAEDLYTQLDKRQRTLCDLLIIELISQLRDAPEDNTLQHMSDSDIQAILRGPVAAALMLGAVFPGEEPASDSHDDLSSLFDYDSSDLDDDDDDSGFFDSADAGDTSSYHNPFSSSFPHSTFRSSQPTNWHDRRGANRGAWSAFDFSESGQQDNRHVFGKRSALPARSTMTPPPQPPLRSSLFILLVLHRLYERVATACADALRSCKRGWDRLRRIWLK